MSTVTKNIGCRACVKNDSNVDWCCYDCNAPALKGCGKFGAFGGVGGYLGMTSNCETCGCSINVHDFYTEKNGVCERWEKLKK
jgi:hypothetical protein